MKFKNVMNKLLAGVLAVGMAVTAVPAFAEETVEATIPVSNFADVVVNTNTGAGYNTRGVYVNTLTDKDLSMYCVRPYAEFEIPYAEYATKAVLQVYAYITSQRDTCSGLYVKTDNFLEIKPTGFYAEDSDEFTYYSTEVNKTDGDRQTINAATTFAEKLNFTASGDYQIYTGNVKLDYTDKLDAVKANGGKLAFYVRGGNNNTFNLDRASLLVTYDKASLEGMAVSELEGAYTADAIAAFVSNYNGILFNINTDAVINLNAIYAKLAAKNQESAFSSIDEFVKAYEAETAAVIKSIKHAPANYAILNQRQKLNKVTSGFKALVNTYSYTRDDNGQPVQLNKNSIYIYQATPIYNYKLTNTDAITDIKFVAQINNANADDMSVGLCYSVVDEFPVSTAVKEYAETDEVYTTLKNLQMTRKNFTAAVGNASADIDLNDIKEELKAKEEANGYANVLVKVDFGGGSLFNDTEQSYLQVTYDTSLIDSHFESEVEGAVTADAMKAVVEKYNEFIGADTSALVNINYVYADLAKEVENGKVYTYETLKADFDEFVKNYLVDVTYAAPNNYIMYRNEARQSFNGKYTAPRVLLNSIVGLVDNETDPYYGKKWKMGDISLFHIYPILGYDIENTQAITKIVYNIGTRDGGTGRVYYSVEDSFPLSGTAGEYMENTDEYAAVTKYWDTKKQIGDCDGEVDITSYVLSDLKKNSSATLVMSQMNGSTNVIFDIDKTTLTVTYDITAIENDSAYDYNVSARLGEYYSVTETTETRNTTVEASVTANTTTAGGYTAVCAAYKDGKLVNVKTSQQQAMNIMGRTKIEFKDFANCDYDKIKVLVLDGAGTITPLAVNAEMTKTAE